MLKIKYISTDIKIHAEKLKTFESKHKVQTGVRVYGFKNDLCLSETVFIFPLGIPA